MAKYKVVLRKRSEHWYDYPWYAGIYSLDDGFFHDSIVACTKLGAKIKAKRLIKKLDYPKRRPQSEEYIIEV